MNMRLLKYFTICRELDEEDEAHQAEIAARDLWMHGKDQPPDKLLKREAANRRKRNK